MTRMIRPLGFAPERQTDDLGVNMNEVGDHRHRDPIVHERRGGRRRAHGDPSPTSPLNRWVTSLAPASMAPWTWSLPAAVPDRHHHPSLDAPRDGVRRARALRGEGQHGDAGGSASSHARSTGTIQPGGWAPGLPPRNGPSRWAPRISRPRYPRRLAASAEPGEGLGIAVERRRDERRAPGGDALGGEQLVEPVPVRARARDRRRCRRGRSPGGRPVPGPGCGRRPRRPWSGWIAAIRPASSISTHRAPPAGPVSTTLLAVTSQAAPTRRRHSVTLSGHETRS